MGGVVIIRSLVVIFIIGLAGFWWLTEPAPDVRLTVQDLQVDPVAGEYVFHAAGCGGCHRAVDEGDNKFLLTGGQGFESPFGTFYAPNVSMDPDHGIGAWDLIDFERAVRRGVSPDGRHYFPAFPYGSYANMTDQDLVNLWGFWQGLPASDQVSNSHDLPIVFQWRRPLGIWKHLNLPINAPPVVAQDADTVRGAYLVQALGHCAECHTPRNVIGGLTTEQWMYGAASPDGKGRIPNITGRALGWGASDIAEYLRSGFTPDYDVAGGAMAEVVENTAYLTDQDRQAIGAYIATLE